MTLHLSNNLLTGNIPVSVGSLPHLQSLFLANNLLSGSLPLSVGKLSRLQIMHLDNNGLYGIIPSSIGNLTEMVFLYAFNNSLSGTIPSAIGNMTKLKILDLSNNNLISRNITNILLNLFKHDQLYLLSISNNVNVRGDLSELKYLGDTVQSSLVYFIAHNCNLFGPLPENIRFDSLKYFTAYNNRLSCDIPNNLISNTKSSTSIILPSNLFTIKKDIPKWVACSKFITAKSLYIDNFDKVKSVILVVVSGVLITIILTQKICCFQNKKTKNINNNRSIAINKKSKNISDFKISNQNICDASSYQKLPAAQKKKRKNADADKLAMDLFLENILHIKTNFNDTKLLIIA
eukprot:58953_1